MTNVLKLAPLTKKQTPTKETPVDSPRRTSEDKVFPVTVTPFVYKETPKC